MNKQKMLLMVLLTCCAWMVRGQNVGTNVGTQGSNSANASKGGVGSNLVNVDAYTGTGSVYVPIYDRSVNGLNVGVGLGYNCKGIRVDETASPVGLGWQLYAGGEITREVHGIEDEITMPGTKFTFGTYGNSHDSLQGILVPGVINATNTNPYNTDHIYDDSEPDIFNVNLGGINISFAYDKDANGAVYKTYPASNIKIEIVTKDWVSGAYTNVRNGVQKNCGYDSTHNIVCFIITDEKGNKFYFDRGDYEIKPYDFSGQLVITGGTYPSYTYAPMFTVNTGIYYATTRWVLDKIVTQDGQEIQYDYTTAYVDYLSDITETQVPSTSSSIIYDEQRWTGRKKHLTQIEYPDGINVLFDVAASTNARCDCRGEFALKNITIESEYDPTYKHSITYRLNHSYFNTPESGISSELPYVSTCDSIDTLLDVPYVYDPEEVAAIRKDHFEKSLRLKLNSISRIGTDGTSTEQIFGFEYSNINLPLRFSPAKDFYGFYNGATSNPNSVAHYYPAPDRSYDVDSAQAWVLKKITNALGGTTSITYTDYSLDNPDCGYGNVDYPDVPGYYTPMGCTIDPYLDGQEENDGLVVWKITNEDGYTAQNNITTEYTYSGGQRFYRGGYMHYQESGGVNVYTNYFVDPHDYINGSNHGFTNVTITVTGYNSQQLSKQKQVFSNLIYQVLGPGDPGGPTYNSCLTKPTGDRLENFSGSLAKHRMGLPLTDTAYDEHNYITGVTNYTYEYKLDSDSITALNIPYRQPSGTGYPVYPYNNWEYKVLDNHTARVTASTVQSFIYNPSSSSYRILQKDYGYTYDANNNIKRTSWTDSKGDVFKSYALYNYDYYPSYTSNTALSTMHSLQMEYQLGSEVWKMNGTSDSTLMNYQLTAPTVDNGIVRFQASFNTALNSELSAANAANATYINRGNALDFLNTSSYGSDLKMQVRDIEYDDQGNALESYQDIRDIYASAIWDTHFGHKIAEVANAHYDDIAYTSFDGIYEPLGVSDYNKGNWDFDPDYKIFYTGVSGLNNAITGKYIYDLVYGVSTNSYMKSKPLNNITYLVSYWVYTSNSSGNVSVNKFNGTTNTGTVTMTLKNTVGQWKLYTGTCTPSAGEYIKISNPGGIIASRVCLDEVRLYPVNASMTTMTYKPLFGVGSMCDAMNQITYTEYDAQGRPAVVRDMRGNIISKTEHFFQDADANTSSLTPNTTY